MSVIHIVKVSGKSKADLVRALHSAIKELDTTVEVKTNVSFNFAGSNTGDDNDDETEEVDSPYSGTPSAHLVTVIDNEKDSENIPWDSRIHSGGKSVNKDGSWKLKKGVDKAVVAQVKAELLYRGAGSTAPVTQPVYEQPVVHQPVTQPVVQQAPVTQPGPSLPNVGGPALPQVTAGHTLQSFQSNFALVVSALITQGKITQDYVNTLKNHFQTEVYLFNADQQAAVFHEFVKCQIIQQVG